MKNENEKIIMGTLGVINANYKGQQFVIEALAKLNNPNYEYQIVGPGDKTFLLNKAKEFNVENQVKFVGTLSHEEIFDWLDSVDIYIQPSLAEGLPRSLVEAMSRGCTCLGSDVGGIPELLNEKSLFEKKNVIELSEKIKNLSSEKMLEQAKLNFEKSKKFDPKNLEEKRDKFYNEFKKECMTLKK